MTDFDCEASTFLVGGSSISFLGISHVGMERYWDNSTTIWCRFRNGFIFGNCTKGQEIVGEEPSIFFAAITVAGRVASLISIGTVCCWIRLTNNTFSFIVFFSAVIASRIICFFMRAGKKSNF